MKRCSYFIVSYSQIIHYAASDDEKNKTANVNQWAALAVEHLLYMVFHLLYWTKRLQFLLNALTT